MTPAQAAAKTVSSSITDPRAGRTGTVVEQARLSLADSAGQPQGTIGIRWPAPSSPNAVSYFNYDDPVLIWMTDAAVVYTFWADTFTATPVGTNSNGNSNVAVTVQPLVNGSITAIQFWKIGTDVGTHVGAVWQESNQAKLGSVTFTGETATGWQTATLTPAIALTSGQRYRISVSRPVTGYAQYAGFTGLTIPGIMTMDMVGSYVLGSQTAYPATDYSGNSWWIDVLFSVG